MSKFQVDLNVAKGGTIDIANDVFPVWWMEVYPFYFNKSKLLLHGEIKKLHCLQDRMIETDFLQTKGDGDNR